MKEPVVPVRDIARELSRRFSTMTHEEIDILENLLIPMKFKKGVEILSQGQVAEYIYYLHTGLIRQYYFKNGKEMTSNLAVDGSIFMSIESLFRETPSSEVIEALETC